MSEPHPPPCPPESEPREVGQRRPVMQRGIIILPSAFTLGNLFFGMYGIVAATRGDFEWAGWFIVIAGVLDMLDGRIARFTRTGSRFGAELDSLVDAISFGVAPAIIAFEIFFAADRSWSWALSWVYVTAVVVRLARFNIEQGGEAKSHFNGLPSPTAGMLIASWYPFSQTAFFRTWLSDLPWGDIMGIGMVLLGVLLMSHIPYAKVPRIELRTTRGRLTTVWGLVLLGLAITVPHYFFFCGLGLYVLWGLLKSVLLGLLDRLPERDPLLDLDEDATYVEALSRTMDYTDINPGRAPAPAPHSPENDA
ncbi:MAG: CDP-diacylglycerol--serine O-phosphatidyltransferase [Longimicrobiales bacterium]|nr:CDP-diacylglycerol--serine O-phosphatidyltransferase [Longimicrobiales bacterium]